MIVTVLGNFETHFTLRSPDVMAKEQISSIAADSKLKLTHVVLSHGQHASQLMLTEHSKGELADVVQKAKAIAEELAAKSLIVQRIKIETDADNPVAPINAAEARRLPKDWHFEHHVKLLLSGEADLEKVGVLAGQHGARLSRNALRKRPDNLEERFLTQRIYGQGIEAAREHLSGLLKNLTGNGYTVLEMEAEYVVFDSNSGLDAGWIEPQP